MPRQEDLPFFSKKYFDKTTSVFTSQSDTLSIEILTTDQKFNELESEWNDLLIKSDSDSIFLTWEWISTWWKYFHTDTSPWIITARHIKTNQLLGIAPLAIRNIRNIAHFFDQTLIFMGNGSAAPDHLDFIMMQGYEDVIAQQFSAAIWQEQYNWNQMKLGGLASTSLVLQMLLQQHPELKRKIDRIICPYLPLPENWETLHQSLSKNMRYSLGRFERRLTKDYPQVNQFRKIKTPAEIKDFMAVLVDLHTASQRRKNKTGLFVDQNMIDFHTEIAHIFLHKGWLRSYTLDVGKTSIAALHCFQYNGIVSFYQSGFDPFWQRYSPGTQIMAYAIKLAIQEKNKRFDFLRGEEDYKFKWTQSSATNLTFTIPFSLQSQVGLQLKQFSQKVLSSQQNKPSFSNIN